MLRKASEAVSEGNGPIPQQEEYGSGQPTLAGAFREIREKFDDFHDEMTGLFEQLAARLQQDVRQRRNAMEADETNTKTRERTEGAAIAYKRCVRIAVLLNKRFKIDRRPQPLSAWKPNLPISLAGKTF